MEQPDRLFVLTRTSLPKGLKVAQAVHAALLAATSLEFDESKAYVVVLDGGEANDLVDLKRRIEETGTKTVHFVDSDIDEGMTSLAFLGSTVTRPITKSLRLVG